MFIYYVCIDLYVYGEMWWSHVKVRKWHVDFVLSFPVGSS